MLPSKIGSMIRSMIILALFTILAGCSTNPSISEPQEEIQNNGLISELNRNLSYQYPNRFKAVHRVALTIAGKSYVLNGYLTINRANKQIHLIAQNDMGGTLFEVHTQEGETHIQSTTDFLKTSWLEKSVVKDLENLYLPPPLPSPALSLNQDKIFLFSKNQAGRIHREYQFKKTASRQNEDNPQKGYRLTGYRQVENNKEIYSVSYIYDKKNDGRYPSFIAIEDHILNYQLKINIQYFFRPKIQQKQGRSSNIDLTKEEKQ